MRRASEQELSEFKQEAFQNAVRLFRDACILYSHKSYPSAYGLGVLAYEELGKVHVIDRTCDAMCLNPDSWDSIYDGFLTRELLTDHRHKQERAYADTTPRAGTFQEPKGRFIADGGLDRTKQQAFYVELEGTDVRAPSRVTKEKAYALLQDILKALEESGDIGFSGFHADSNTQSEWQAAEQLATARAAFEKCLIHNRGQGEP